jgi:membrane protein
VRVEVIQLRMERNAPFEGISWKAVGRRSWSRILDAHIMDQAAMLAFYLLLSIFPMLFFLIIVFGWLFRFGPSLQEVLHRYLITIAPEAASSLINKGLTQITTGPDVLKFSFALLFTWLSASQGVRAIMQGLNIAYGIQESRRWWRQYLTSSLLTLVSLVLIATGLLVLLYGAFFSRLLGNVFGVLRLASGLWQILEWILFLAFVLMVFNFLYAYGPAVRRPQWQWLMPGTIVAVGLWVLVSLGFKLYLHYFIGSFTIYGSIGAMIILQLWFYFFGVAILVGGAVNSEFEKARNDVGPIVPKSQIH